MTNYIEIIKIFMPSTSLIEPPERLPEEDAFLFSVGYDGWIECYLKERRDS